MSEDTTTSFRRKGGLLNDRLGTFTCEPSFALMGGEPIHYADGHHFEGVAVVQLSRWLRGTPEVPTGIWVLSTIRDADTGEVVYLDEAAVGAARKEAHVRLEAVVEAYQQEVRDGRVLR